MKIIINNFIPFGDFKAILLLGLIFVKRSTKVTCSLIQHEKIHWEQQKETLIVGFLFIYTISFVFQYVHCLFNKAVGKGPGGRSLWMRAYRTNVFEREAYAKQNDPTYIENRLCFAWLEEPFIV